MAVWLVMMPVVTQDGNAHYSMGGIRRTLGEQHSWLTCCGAVPLDRMSNRSEEERK